jgi:Exo-beta-D-glucosaminidase Ig-fold domain/Concanavalin A-like lectin/glucanases superfamily/Glycosyl hydrolases family 2/Glycosyl hydrolases family 2, sugar binding domain/Glycosyl hydrolases family 2, TIM barrel domain
MMAGHIGCRSLRRKSMDRLFSGLGRQVHGYVILACLWATTMGAYSQTVTNDPSSYGPFNGIFLPDGDGLKKPLVKDDSVLRADSPWSLYGWVKYEQALKAPSLVAGIGDPTEEYSRFLALDDGQLLLWMGKDNSLAGPASLGPGKWHFLAATFDGSESRIYSDGELAAHGKLDLGSVSPSLQMAPPFFPLASWQHFGGKIASLNLIRKALTDDEIKRLNHQPEDFSLAEFEEGSKPWPVQTRGQAGYRAPQDGATMPRSKAPFSHPVAQDLPAQRNSLEPKGDNEWTLAGWNLTPAPKVDAQGAAISQPGFKAKGWWAATVPGTVLTTMIDRGVYPDPDYGLNNLAIPESLNKQDYWYRMEFKTPKGTSGRRFTLTFQGINYKAEVWLNGQSLGTITGAFIRGVFDVSGVVKAGETNALAVRVSPPPHPGIPQEQSIKGGPGENGGMMCLDGPTFVATEGWDWIPAVRDRDTGIWQPVTLTATSTVKIGDAQVVTKLQLPDTSSADVEITVPLENFSGIPVRGTLKASFDEIAVTKDITLAPGKSSVRLSSSEFAKLTVQHPRLWWPNGYGKQELYSLKLSFSEGSNESDAKQVRFGIREITYALSLLDSTGHLRRLEYSPTAARAANQQVVDVSHDGMREIPAAEPFPATYPAEWKEHWKSWVASLAPGGESSSAVKMIDDPKAGPYLVIKVNGVKIACRGGNWGMDDSRKRVSRAHLEPYFRLHHDANLNIIRNWVGQDTEEVFFDLADEYGLLVWNDFWESTENYNVEAQDPALFLDNARDAILRFRNHPSIVMWCGRNEGVPQPIISDGLAELIRSLDGTRYYSPSSNQVNLQNSGPYKYMDPVLYYTALNRGFAVETGTPSFSTLESFRASIPKEDQWPVSDAWAYHDWHQSGNGDMAPFMAQMQAEFGAPTSLEDFERKAQMLNYVDLRAIFEGMNAHLWTPNSGRMLWMTQPAWPSNTWQILSSDYDTQASFYGVKKACEPVHVQLDLSNYDVAVVNTTATALAALLVTADVYSLDDKLLLHHEEKKDASADSVNDGFKLDLAKLLADGVVLVKLGLRNAAGEIVSENFYWLGADSASYRQLNRLTAASVSATASSLSADGNVHVRVKIQNTGSVVSLVDKLTLLNASDGSRILPAYFTDNYVSLLPGESREIQIESPAAAVRGAVQVAMRGWNLVSQTVPVSAQK